MADTERSVSLERVGPGRFRATNVRGGTIEIGTGEDADFTPIELLLVALGGCSAIEVDVITGKRVQAERLDVTVRSDKIRDEHGNHLVDVAVTLDPEYPAGADGDRERDRLPDVVRQTRDRLCTVSRTVELGTPVDLRLA